MFADRQSAGNSPICIERLYMQVKAGAMAFAQVLRIMFGIPSDPHAFAGLKIFSSLATPFVSMVSWSRVGKGASFILGRGVPSFGVKADLN